MRKLSLAGAPQPDLVDEDQAEVENQMRHALGLPSTLPRRDKERQPAAPGLVVEHRSPRHAPHLNTNRLQIAEQALAAEQVAHQQAARALRHAQEALLEAETKLGHSELARHEAVEARARIELALAAEREARAALESELETLRSREAARPEAKPRRVAAPVATDEPADSAAPVEWWVPGWKRAR